MKLIALPIGLLAVAPLAVAQSNHPAQDPGFINLTTPMVLEKGKSLANLGVNYAGDPGSQVFTGVGYGYGIGNGWEFDLRGDFSSFKSHGFGGNGLIRFGGSAGEALVKYRIPGMGFDLSAEGGMSYTDTPAQTRRGEFIFGLSGGYSVADGVRVYVNPKIVAQNGEPLIGFGIGVIGRIVPGIHLYGEWTPLLDGQNTINTSNGNFSRVQLYGVGLRFDRISPGLLLDLSYTNSSGATTGFGLTPSLGNVGGVQAELTYKF